MTIMIIYTSRYGGHGMTTVSSRQEVRDWMSKNFMLYNYNPSNLTLIENPTKINVYDFISGRVE